MKIKFFVRFRPEFWNFLEKYDNWYFWRC